TNSLKTPQLETKYKYNRKHLTSFYMRLWSSNKQNISHLFFSCPTPDFYLKFSFKHINDKDITFYKTINKHHLTTISFASKNKNYNARNEKVRSTKVNFLRKKNVLTAKLLKPST